MTANPDTSARCLLGTICQSQSTIGSCMTEVCDDGNHHTADARLSCVMIPGHRWRSVAIKVRRVWTSPPALRQKRVPNDYDTGCRGLPCDPVRARCLCSALHLHRYLHWRDDSMCSCACLSLVPANMPVSMYLDRSLHPCVLFNATTPHGMVAREKNDR